MSTAYGAVTMKVALLNGRALKAAPEYEDCRRIADEKGVRLQDVFDAATAAWQQQRHAGNT